jgi:hypothetical protein
MDALLKTIAKNIQENMTEAEKVEFVNMDEKTQIDYSLALGVEVLRKWRDMATETMLNANKMEDFCKICAAQF